MKTLKQSFGCFSLLVLMLSACASKEKAGENEMILIDVSRDYPAKAMVLQDIAEVDYIRLDTSEELLWQGWTVNTFTDRYIIDYNIRTGDVLFFDASGKGIRKINRKGESGEEYSLYSSFLLDEAKEELYFNDGNKKKILVYDLNGNFKRAFDHAPEKRYTDLWVLDANRLITYNHIYSEEEPNSFLVLSKATGEIEQEFILQPDGRKINEQYRMQRGEDVIVFMIQTFPLLNHTSDFILSDMSNDTIFSMNASLERVPWIIQQPSRATMDPEIFLSCALESRDLIFLYTIEKKIAGEGMRGRAKDNSLVYDKKEGKVYQQDIQNADFTSEKKVVITPQTTLLSPSNANVYLKVLNAGDLVEAYENNELKGRLKEIAKDLDEEDNPVLLVARFK